MNNVHKQDLKIFIACAVLYAVVQGLICCEIIDPFWELNIVMICINIILAVSLNLINGYTGQFSIGHAGFMAVGAYVGAVVTMMWEYPFALG
ncbi:MAG: branched-chain amino acid ABC transporter permease, partial [Phascolarctobacterium sp.]|nr:branched-chain amino acid ABC transporter permease [Candidatus Phascolarctobacterium caballi]